MKTHWRALHSSDPAAEGDDPTLHPVFRRVLAVGLLFATAAFVLGLVLEGRGSVATMFDRVAYSLGTLGMLLLELGVLFFPRRFRTFATVLVTGVALFFLAKLSFLLFFAPPPVNILGEMTESLFWSPVIYVLAFLIPGLSFARRVALAFAVLLPTLSLLYAVPALVGGRTNWGVVHALGQLTFANLAMLALTRGFTALKGHLVMVQTRGDELHKLAHTDPLTGLPNRLHCFTHLEALLEQPRASESGFAVIFIDLDRFKAVNDRFGHAAGDELLKQIAQRLHVHLRQNDLLARISGDEFVVVAKAVTSPVVAETVVRKLYGSFAAPFSIGGDSLNASASFGYCLYPQHGNSVEALLQHADSAMYQVKAAGRNGVQGFSQAAPKPEVTLQASIVGAAERGELGLHYQPRFDLTSGELVSLEALLRPQHPTHGAVAPGVALQSALENGLDDLEAFLLSAACDQNARWQRAGFAPVSVAVNVSPWAFSQAGFFSSVERSLDTSGLNPADLTLELGEEALSEAHSGAILARLKRLGVGLSLDNFGRGACSLRYLEQLPFDSLTLDRSLAEALAKPLRQPHFALAVVEAAAALARTLDLVLIAKGIETQAQADQLRELGCQVGQGFIFSRAVSPENLELILPRKQPERYSKKVGGHPKETLN